MPYGYTGKILKVDLSKARLTIEEPPESFYRQYMGGSALNLYYLLRRWLQISMPSARITYLPSV